MSRKKQTWQVGDVFAVPLKDGTYATGQVVGREPDALDSVTCAFFDLRARDNLICPTGPLSSGRLIAVLFTSYDLLNAGLWKVVGQSPIAIDKRSFPYEESRSRGWVGAKVIGSAIVNEFLNAYYALQPWDDWKDPHYLDSLLVSPDKKPTKLLYKK